MLPGARTAAFQCSLRQVSASSMLQGARFGVGGSAQHKGAPTQVALRLPLVQREILLHGRGLERSNPIVLTKQVLHSSATCCQARDSAHAMGSYQTSFMLV